MAAKSKNTKIPNTMYKPAIQTQATGSLPPAPRLLLTLTPLMVLFKAS
jgi:hypothetical protein